MGEFPVLLVDFKQGKSAVFIHVPNAVPDAFLVKYQYWLPKMTATLLNFNLKVSVRVLSHQHRVPYKNGVQLFYNSFCCLFHGCSPFRCLIKEKKASSLADSTSAPYP